MCRVVVRLFLLEFMRSSGGIIRMISEILQRKCDLFAENNQILKKGFKWDYSMMHRLGALLYTNVGLTVDIEAIKMSKEIIKKNTGLFSSFKETTFFALSTLLSLEDNPEVLFEKVMGVYNDMKHAGFHASAYLTLAAFSIAKQAEAYDVQLVINKAKDIYDAMKQEHRFLTSVDDYGYAAMLATTDLSVFDAIREMETCYDILKKDFGTGNALQSLTHVLTIGEEPAQAKCERVKQIDQGLANKGCKLSRYSELATLGILTLISEDVEKLTDEISEAYQYLAQKKGLGIWSLSKTERTMYGAALVMAEYIKDIEKNPITITLTNSITNILIAQQTAMIIAASSASSAAAATSGS